MDILERTWYKKAASSVNGTFGGYRLRRKKYRCTVFRLSLFRIQWVLGATRLVDFTGLDHYMSGTQNRFQARGRPCRRRHNYSRASLSLYGGSSVDSLFSSVPLAIYDQGYTGRNNSTVHLVETQSGPYHSTN